MELSKVDATGMILGRNLISFFFFLNLGKYLASDNTIKRVIYDDQEVTDHQKINSHIFSFYKKLFEERLQNDSKKLLEFLKNIPVQSFTEQQKKICEGELTEKEIYQSTISMENNKSPGNDGLTKEFYCTFWREIKNTFLNSLRESKCLKAVSTSQRQVIIRLIEKPNKDKRCFSLLNIDQKHIKNVRSKIGERSIFNRFRSDCIRQQQVLRRKWKAQS